MNTDVPSQPAARATFVKRSSRCQFVIIGCSHFKSRRRRRLCRAPISRLSRSHLVTKRRHISGDRLAGQVSGEDATSPLERRTCQGSCTPASRSSSLCSDVAAFRVHVPDTAPTNHVLEDLEGQEGRQADGAPTSSVDLNLMKKGLAWYTAGLSRSQHQEAPGLLYAGLGKCRARGSMCMFSMMTAGPSR